MSSSARQSLEGSYWDSILAELSIPKEVATTLDTEGVDDATTLVACTVEELRQLGLKLGHAKKLHKRCQQEIGTVSAAQADIGPTRTGASLNQRENLSPDSSDNHHGRYTRIGFLGSGSFGVTQKMRDTRSGQIVAMKTIKCQGLTEANTALREATATMSKQHENIVQATDCWLGKDEFQQYTVNIAMEYCDGGDLRQYITKATESIPECVIVSVILRPLLQALEFLHSRNMMHRDIKPSNILLKPTESSSKRSISSRPSRGEEHDEEGENSRSSITNAEFTPKLCDFGLATEHLGTVTNSVAGTQSYMAPEVLGEEGYNMKADIWSLGVTAAYLLTQEEPRGAVYSEAKAKKFTDRLKDVSGYSTELVDAVIAMLTYNADTRPSTVQLLAMAPFTLQHAKAFEDIANELLADLSPASRNPSRYDLFLSHYQATGGDQVATLHLKLKERGIISWYDQEEADITAPGMLEGIKSSRALLLFLSDGVMSRNYVRFEIRCAVKLKIPIVLMHETDPRHNPCDFIREIQVAPSDLKSVLTNIESIPWRRRKFEQNAVLAELLSKIPEGAVKYRVEMQRQTSANTTQRKSSASIADEMNKSQQLLSPTPRESKPWGSIKFLNDKGNQYLLADDLMYLGRNADCAIRINDKIISGQHCRLKRVWNKDQSGFKAYLKDMSSNGTSLNGRFMGKGLEAELKNNDKIQLYKIADYKMLTEDEKKDKNLLEFQILFESVRANIFRSTSAPATLTPLSKKRPRDSTDSTSSTTSLGEKHRLPKRQMLRRQTPVTNLE